MAEIPVDDTATDLLALMLECKGTLDNAAYVVEEVHAVSGSKAMDQLDDDAEY